MSHSAKRVPTDHVRATHAKVSQPEHRRKRPPPQIDPEAARQRQVRHAIEDLMIERELGLSGDGK